jgi:hypothetical protein
MPVTARLYASLTGVREKVAVPHTIRLLTKDRAALSRSLRKILQWDFERAVLAHNTVVEHGAYDSIRRAFEAVL